MANDYSQWDNNVSSPICWGISVIWLEMHMFHTRKRERERDAKGPNITLALNCDGV